jgi:hypothetical protein
MRGAGFRKLMAAMRRRDWGVVLTSFRVLAIREGFVRAIVG